MKSKRTKEELLNEAREYFFKEGKIRIGTIQLVFEVGYLTARDAFNQLVSEGIGKLNKDGILEKI